MTQLATIIVLAMTVEALIEYASLIVVDRSICWKQIAALLLGVALSVLAATDLYAMLGIAFTLPYVGIVLTGVLFSRGANYVADIVKKFQGAVKDDREAN